MHIPSLQGRALKALIRLFSLVLDSFETTAAEDVTAHAAAAPEAQDLRMAITFRLEKKRTLVEAIRALAALVEVRSFCQSPHRVMIQTHATPFRAERP